LKSDLECGGKRSATPLWMVFESSVRHPKRRRRFALPAQSKLEIEK
jgi:hypothetical protein